MLSGHRIVQGTLLAGYRALFVNGLFRYSMGRRVFFSLYDLYKLLFEAGPIRALQAFVPPGSTVIDVGANIGFFTQRFADWAGSGGMVIAVEPESRNFDELRRRCRTRNLTGVVKLYQAVADEKSGTRHLLVNPDHPGDHRIGTAGEPVEAITVDGLRQAHGRPITLIKIDVQGAEMRVLAGAEFTLTADKPALFTEVDRRALAEFDSTIEDLLNFTRRHGYSPFRLKSDGPAPLRETDIEDLVSHRGYVDVLFLPTPARAT